MRWKMRQEFLIAYEKANEVLEKISYSKKEMIRTASVIDAVEEMLDVDIKFSDYNFSEFSKSNQKITFDRYGAAMCITKDNEKRKATILLNDKETAEMKRFSLIHEIGHLVTQPLDFTQDYQVSTHIDMDITSIPDKVLDKKGYSFLIQEQIANIFALLVLIPYDMLIEAMRKYDTISEVAEFFGVEKDALISRLELEDAKKKLVNA